VLRHRFSSTLAERHPRSFSFGLAHSSLSPSPLPSFPLSSHTPLALSQLLIHLQRMRTALPRLSQLSQHLTSPVSRPMLVRTRSSLLSPLEADRPFLQTPKAVETLATGPQELKNPGLVLLVVRRRSSREGDEENLPALLVRERLQDQRDSASEDSWGRPASIRRELTVFSSPLRTTLPPQPLSHSSFSPLHYLPSIPPILPSVPPIHNFLPRFRPQPQTDKRTPTSSRSSRPLASSRKATPSSLSPSARTSRRAPGLRP
jgi:hypothetical protein